LQNTWNGYFFDNGKVKTSSIVSYGLGPLLKLSGIDSLFRVFRHPEKKLLSEGHSQKGLEAYLNFATSKINIFLAAVREAVGHERWTPDTRVKNRLLSVTTLIVTS
jgi:hypothetical protein